MILVFLGCPPEGSLLYHFTYVSIYVHRKKDANAKLQHFHSSWKGRNILKTYRFNPKFLQSIIVRVVTATSFCYTKYIPPSRCNFSQYIPG